MPEEVASASAPPDSNATPASVPESHEPLAMPDAALPGMDVVAVEEAVRRAVAAIRADGRPYLLEARTYRFRAHSMYDPELYRTKAEVEEWKKRDPVVTLAAALAASGVLAADERARIEAAVAAEVDAAVAFAEAGPWEPVADLTRDVYAPAEERR
jgi:TPP-dependent pyruvate/acetoin dehydrogenase alpha subunit